ncbi:LysR family transcriptional regulator [Paraburkholderia heleia]|uniref:LysR family transcriptional regulator n=1 Tax=Paraburkholderia heleia TaxID=634127 RepID=UPI0005AA9972|nr:LysR family transcriptional regulator [Paraburkholderia heleia]
MSFSLQQLHMFTTIVDCGSLGRAASTLGLTQPALSRAIKRLESTVGSPLFERHARGMQLTAIGEALLPHAMSLQRNAENAQEELDAMRGLKKGVIKVGAVASIATLVLPVALGNVLKKWPNLRVEAHEGVWDRLAEGLLTHEIDIALATSDVQTDEISAIADCRWTDYSHVIASANHPLRRKRQLRLEDTLSQQWTLTPEGTGPYAHMKSTFATAGVPFPEIAVQTRSVTLIKSLVARSGFITWMSEPMYDMEKAAGILDRLKIDGLEAPRTLTAFRRRDGILPAPAAKLLDELRHLTSGTADQA